MAPDDDERARILALAAIIFAALREDPNGVSTKELAAFAAARNPATAGDIPKAIPLLIHAGAAELSSDGELRLTPEARADASSFLKKVALLSETIVLSPPPAAASEEKLARYPARDPRAEEWLGRNTPVDHVGRLSRTCPECGRETVQDSWTVIIGLWTGFSLPFAKRSTAGKMGTRATFYSCAECGALMPGDEKALQWLVKNAGSPLLAHPRR